MFAQIKGTIIKILDTTIIVETNHIGYEIFLSEKDLGPLEIDREITLWTHLDVGENHLRLYGFSDFTDRNMFQLLISISGIGPKMALSILNATTNQQIKDAVVNSDPSLFRSISGIGTKIANRVLLELQSKIGEIDIEFLQKTKIKKAEMGTIFAALKTLGYGRTEIREALQQVDSNLSTEEKIKTVLRELGKQN